MIAAPFLPVLGKFALGPFGWCILALVFGPLILSPFVRSGERKRRRAIFASMGLAEKSRTEVFGDDWRHIARIIRDSTVSSISPWVAVGGRSGEIALFEFTTDFDSSTPAMWPVVAFRLPGPLPDFEIHHRLLGDKLSKRISKLLGPSRTASVGAPPVVKMGVTLGGVRIGSSFDRPPLQQVTLEANEQFADKYRVYAADPAAMSRIATPSFMEKLVQLDDGTLHIVCSGGWLFLYHYGFRKVPPENFPALFEESVDVLSRLNLQASVEGDAQTAVEN